MATSDCIAMFAFSRQECIPVGCVPPSAVAVPGGGGSPTGTPLGPDPPDQAPPDQTPPHSPLLGAEPPRREQTPSTTNLPRSSPPGPGTPPCGQTHTCKHITLPQTSFAGGKKDGKYQRKRNIDVTCKWTSRR